MLHSQSSKTNSRRVLRRAFSLCSAVFGLSLIATLAFMSQPASSSAAGKLSEKANFRISEREILAGHKVH